MLAICYQVGMQGWKAAMSFGMAQMQAVKALWEFRIFFILFTVMED